jgi:hypothetical protein
VTAIIRRRLFRSFVLPLMAALVALRFEAVDLVAAPRAAGGAAGAVSVTSDPAGAAVYVDGDFVGQTPITVQSLSAGDHRVRIVKDGYLEHGCLVRVVQNRRQRISRSRRMAVC